MNTQLLDSTNDVSNDNAAHDGEFTSIPRIPNTKRDRKECRPFGAHFFTQGTVCEIQVTKSMHPTPIQITVRDVVKNAPDSYVIRTGKINPSTDCEEGFNISHVVGIIKHVTGVVKIDHEEHGDRHDLLEQESCYEHLGTIKHPSQYRTDSIGKLMLAIVPAVIKDDQHLDFEKLKKLLLEQNVFHTIDTGLEWRSKVYVINKKKFRKVLKRLIPRCLLNHFKAQKAYDDMMFRDMIDEFDDAGGSW